MGDMSVVLELLRAERASKGTPEMLDELGRVFRHHERKGTVTVEYDTRAYYGRP